MALLFAIAIPYIGHVSPHMELRSGAREVAAGLRGARSRAILANKEVIFSLDVDRHYYTITDDPQTHVLPHNVVLSLYTAQTERVGNTSGGIRFFPDGSSTGGRVKLSNENSSYLVTIEWLTGSVEIQGGG